jgi:hypothetical protein
VTLLTLVTEITPNFGTTAPNFQIHFPPTCPGTMSSSESKVQFDANAGMTEPLSSPAITGDVTVTRCEPAVKREVEQASTVIDSTPELVSAKAATSSPPKPHKRRKSRHEAALELSSPLVNAFVLHAQPQSLDESASNSAEVSAETKAAQFAAPASSNTRGKQRAKDLVEGSNSLAAEANSRGAGTFVYFYAVASHQCLLSLNTVFDY